MQNDTDDSLEFNELPPWLNEFFIRDILRKFLCNEKIEVKSLNIEQIGGKGDSYSSEMYRVATKFYNEKKPEVIRSRSIILKTSSVNEDEVQLKEMTMYERVLPQLTKLLESINEPGDFYPATLNVDKYVKVIAMEDLGEQNFVMADRYKGLDLDHVKMTLRKLARMHATSAVVLAKFPNAYDGIDKGMFNTNPKAAQAFFGSMCDAFVDEVSSWKDFEYYAVKLKRVRENFIALSLKVFDRDEGDFLVLTHGDLWTNNMLFKYDDKGKLTDSILIDFQLSCVGSPAIDLIYLIYGSAVDELRQGSFEELTQYYYYELKNILNRLEYDMKKLPSLHAFQLQIQKKFFWAFATTFAILPIQIADDKSGDLETLISAEDAAMLFKRKLYKNPKLIQIAKKILPKFDSKGVLDDM